MGKIFEGYWNCSYCGTNKIRGSIRNCPNCGKPRGSDVKFYMDSTSQEVADSDKVNKNPDWLCSFCDSLNSDSIEICPSCGHSREESDLNYFENLDRQNVQETVKDTYQNNNEKEYIKPKFKNKKFSLRNLLIIAATILLCAGLVYIFVPKTKTIIVQSLPWERTVAVEAYKTVYDNSWILPDGAYNITEKQEIYSYNHVLDHYETKTKQESKQVFDGYDISYSYRDLGNGMFEQVEHRTPKYRTEYYTTTYQDPVYKDIPIYKIKYYYNIEKWVFDHNEKVSGNDGRAYNPDVVYKDGLTRSGGSTEYYAVIDSKGKKYNIDYELWSKLSIGQKYKVKIKTKTIKEIIE